jgi:hypothetical protein
VASASTGSGSNIDGCGDGDGGGGGGGVGGGRTWTADERFAYFRSKMCQAALWADADPSSGSTLFDRLKAAARARMAKLAALCDVRFRELLTERGAAALLVEVVAPAMEPSPATSPSDADAAGVAGVCADRVSRQDHPKVRFCLLVTVWHLPWWFSKYPP